jgi:hypothetical protein
LIARKEALRGLFSWVFSPLKARSSVEKPVDCLPFDYAKALQIPIDRCFAINAKMAEV